MERGERKTEQNQTKPNQTKQEAKKKKKGGNKVKKTGKYRKSYDMTEMHHISDNQSFHIHVLKTDNK